MLSQKYTFALIKTTGSQSHRCKIKTLINNKGSPSLPLSDHNIRRDKLELSLIKVCFKTRNAVKGNAKEEYTVCQKKKKKFF